MRARAPLVVAIGLCCVADASSSSADASIASQAAAAQPSLARRLSWPRVLPCSAFSEIVATSEEPLVIEWLGRAGLHQLAHAGGRQPGRALDDGLGPPTEPASTSVSLVDFPLTLDSVNVRHAGTSRPMREPLSIELRCARPLDAHVRWTWQPSGDEVSVQFIGDAARFAALPDSTRLAGLGENALARERPRLADGVRTWLAATHDLLEAACADRPCGPPSLAALAASGALASGTPRIRLVRHLRDSDGNGTRHEGWRIRGDGDQDTSFALVCTRTHTELGMGEAEETTDCAPQLRAAGGVSLDLTSFRGERYLELPGGAIHIRLDGTARAQIELFNAAIDYRPPPRN